MAVDEGSKDQVTRLPEYGCPHSTVNISISAILVLGDISLVLTLFIMLFPTEPTGLSKDEPMGSEMIQGSVHVRELG